jgi:hypothetical protein
MPMMNEAPAAEHQHLTRARDAALPLADERSSACSAQLTERSKAQSRRYLGTTGSR